RIHRITRKEPSRGKSTIIDYVIASKTCFARVQDTRVLRGTEASTDHYLLRSRIRLPDGTTTKRQRSVKARIKNHKLKEKSVKEEYQKVVEEKFNNGDRREGNA
ncbi:hypothetical protein ILUMI_02114, partial [Ignelater luminosus]